MGFKIDENVGPENADFTAERTFGPIWARLWAAIDLDPSGTAAAVSAVINPAGALTHGTTAFTEWSSAAPVTAILHHRLLELCLIDTDSNAWWEKQSSSAER